MNYNKEKQEIETLENHKAFYKTIKQICEGDFVLSAAKPMNHICSLQDKIGVFIKTEKSLKLANKDQRLRDAEFADKWLEKVSLDLIDSGISW
jgi:hypothetical protein